MIDFTPDMDLTQPGPVVIRKMPADIYHALPRLNAGKVAAFAQSMLQGAAEVNKDHEPTMDMLLGIAIHAKILEPADFAARADHREDIGPGAIVTHRQACEKHPDRLILAKNWLEVIEGIRNGIRRLPRVERLLFDHHPAERELTILWTETLRGEAIPCKARIDFFDAERGTVVDLKTTNDASHNKFERKIGELAYHVRGCWYRRGVQAAGLAEFPTLAWIAVQTKPPYTCGAFKAGDDMVDQGWAEACLGVHRYLAWMKGEPDPYPPAELQVVQLPPWQRTDPQTLVEFTKDFEPQLEPEVSHE